MRSGCNERCPDAALAATFCHRRWNTRGREDDTCLMRLKADLSRDRLSFRANDPRPSVSAARARSVAIVCNINSGVLRWGENSISPRSDSAHRPLVGISRGFRVAYTWCRQRTSLLQICKRAIYYLTYQANLLAKFYVSFDFSLLYSNKERLEHPSLFIKHVNNE